MEGTLRLARSDFAGPVNIGSEEMVTIDGLVDLVCEIAGKTLRKRHVPGPQGVRGRNSDNRLIGERLGWKPSLALRSGLEETYRWIEGQVGRKPDGGVAAAARGGARTPQRVRDASKSLLSREKISVWTTYIQDRMVAGQSAGDGRWRRAGRKRARRSAFASRKRSGGGIDHAAAVSGTSRTTFMLAAALEKADAVLFDRLHPTWDPAAMAAFRAVLAECAGPAPRAAEARDRLPWRR